MLKQLVMIRKNTSKRKTILKPEILSKKEKSIKLLKRKRNMLRRPKLLNSNNKQSKRRGFRKRLLILHILKLRNQENKREKSKNLFILKWRRKLLRLNKSKLNKSQFKLNNNNPNKQNQRLLKNKNKQLKNQCNRRRQKMMDGLLLVKKERNDPYVKYLIEFITLIEWDNI